MNKHAYLIMAHHQFDFLKDLLLELDDARNDIFLHIDKKVNNFDFEGFSGLLQHSRLFFTDRVDVHWGGYSQIACELTLLKAAVPGHYAYYHLISGADFPLKSQDEIHAFFDEQEGKEFLEFDTETEKVPQGVRERISLYHFFRESTCPLAEPFDMVITRLQRLLGINRLKNTNNKIQKGPNWFSITDAFAQYVVSREGWISQYFHHSVCADELFLQTLAVNSEFMENVYDPFCRKEIPGNLRYVDWEHGNGNSPYTFREEDKERLKELPHLFARKFDRNILKE